jgi:hypothetical protein
MSRPASPYEKFFFDWNQMVQFAFQISHPRHVGPFVNKLLKALPAFNVRYQDGMFQRIDNPPVVEQLPVSIKTAVDAEAWARANLGVRPMSDRVAYIAANDDVVAVAASHGVCDGGSMNFLANMRPVKAPQFPFPVDSPFAEEIAKLSPERIAKYIADGQRLSWLERSKKVDNAAKFCGYLAYGFRPDELLCYDKKSRALKGLSEALWGATLLPMLAQTGYEKIGCGMCVNLRPLVPWKEVGNIYTAIPVVCNRTNDDSMTLAELSEEMRKDFKARVKAKEYIISLKTVYGEFAPGPTRRLTTQLSSVGVIKLDDPVVGFWGGQSSESKGNKANLVLQNMSIKARGEVTIYNRMQYSPAVINVKDATKYLRSVNYVLTNIPQTASLREAVDELKKFQRKENL